MSWKYFNNTFNIWKNIIDSFIDIVYLFPPGFFDLNCTNKSEICIAAFKSINHKYLKKSLYRDTNSTFVYYNDLVMIIIIISSFEF